MQGKREEEAGHRGAGYLCWKEKAFAEPALSKVLGFAGAAGPLAVLGSGNKGREGPLPKI